MQLPIEAEAVSSRDRACLWPIALSRQFPDAHPVVALDPDRIQVEDDVEGMCHPDPAASWCDTMRG